MSARVTTAVEETGRVLACKRATGDDDGARLRHEATMLDRARHPGVVELVSCHDVDGVATLYTDFVGAHTLETAPAMPLEQAGAVVAKLASTVADLHSLGLVHGRIDLSHVILGPDRRPILCGFTGAGREGEIPPAGPRAMAEFRDPAALVDAPLSPTVDVFALGTLLRVLVVGEGPEIEPIPHTRFTFGRRRPWAGYLRRALLTLADQSTDEEPLRRPSARRLAADIESLLPRESDTDAFASLRPTPEVTSGRSTGRRLTLIGSAAGLALIFFGLFALRSDGTTTAERTSASTFTTLAPSTTSSTTSTTSTTDASEPAPLSTNPPELAADGTVAIDGHRYQVGQPGDRVAIGDWECDGSRTAAIARPSTGAVFVFDGWPSDGAELSATAISSIVDAVDVRSVDRADCSTLVVVRRDGSEVEVP